jgi:branched-chain amino acid aminotransferase
MSLIQIAEDLGLKVERRQVPVEELETFEEVGACGTAAVISPIKRIYDADLDKEYNYGVEPGPWSAKLYEKLRAIQDGDESDRYGWIDIIE